MPLRYRTGEEIQAGDRILYASEPGKIDFVTISEDPQHAWYVEQYGGGCMVPVPPFGNLFVSHPEEEEDLDFVSRGEPPSV